MITLPEIKRKQPKPAYRKSNAIKELERMAQDEARQKHPTMPHLAPRTYRDDTANKLTNCIVKYITLCGGFASRINSTGIYDNRLKKYRPGTQKKGIADIIATHGCKSLHIEVKHGKDRLSPAQMEISNQVKASGGLYFVARDFEGFKEWFDKI